MRAFVFSAVCYIMETMNSLHKRIIFLDFDGPMHPTGTVQFVDHEHVDFGDAFCWWPTLRNLLHQTNDVGIIIHSTWRLRWTFEELFDIVPPDMRPYLLDVADTNYMGRDQAIVHTWPVYQKQGFLDYIVIDDEPTALPSVQDHVIACSSHSGLSNLMVQTHLREWISKGVNDDCSLCTP